MYRTNFNALKDYVGVTMERTQNIAFGTQVFVAKTGLLTTYPYNFTTGINFTVPKTHVSRQVVKDLDKVNFFLVSSFLEKRPSESFYLITNNNVALIQTGHSNGEAKPDEQKIIANVIFYCNQLLLSTYQMKDYGSIDYMAPNAPRIKGTMRRFQFYAEDRGSTYYYYAESFNKDDTNKNSVIDKSQTVQETICTGVKGYYYLFDDSPDTIITADNGNFTPHNIALSTLNKGFIHVAAVDYVGNISPTSTAEIHYEPKSKDVKRYLLNEVKKKSIYNIDRAFVCYK